MATTTRVAAAQDALKTLIDADTTLDDATISLGTPVAVTKEHIWIPGDITEWSEEVSLTGISSAGSQRQETFTIRVFIAVTKTADLYTDARDRAITLLQALETLIAKNPTLSSTVFHANIVRKDLQEAVVDSDRAVYVEVAILCTAYLTRP